MRRVPIIGLCFTFVRRIRWLGAALAAALVLGAALSPAAASAETIAQARANIAAKQGEINALKSAISIEKGQVAWFISQRATDEARELYWSNEINALRLERTHSEEAITALELKLANARITANGLILGQIAAQGIYAANNEPGNAAVCAAHILELQAGLARTESVLNALIASKQARIAPITDVLLPGAEREYRHWHHEVIELNGKILFATEVINALNGELTTAQNALNTLNAQLLQLQNEPPPASWTKVKYGPLATHIAGILAGPTAGSTVVVVVHGGWWSADEHPEWEDEAQAFLLRDAGLCIMDINYPEIEGSKNGLAFLKQLEAIEKAVEYIIAHAAEYNGNATKIVILGGSTGGNISQLAGQRINKAHAGRIKGVISLSSPMDLPALAKYEVEQNERLKKGEQPWNDSGYVPLTYAVGYPPPELVPGGAHEVAAKEWSPIDNISAASDPHYYLTGGITEGIVPFSQQSAMHAALVAAGANVTLVEVETSGHSFAYFGKVSAGIIAWIKAF